MMRAPATRHPSKRDSWITLLMWGVILSQIVVGFLIWVEAGPLQEKWIISGFIVVTVFFLLHVLYGTAYDLTDDELIVRCGVFRWRVPLTSIQRIKPTQSLWSWGLNYALSLDRLEVRSDRVWWCVSISPEDQHGFLQDLVDRCPTLKLTEESHVERSTGD